jgi:hypothetical protein
LAQIILGGRGFNFVHMKGNTVVQGEIIAKRVKIHRIFFKKFSSPEPAGQYQFKLIHIIF